MRFFFTVILLLFFLYPGHSQDLGIIHVKDLHGLDLSSFVTSNGVGGKAGYFYFFRNNIVGNVDYTYEKGKIDLTQFEIHTINLQGTILLAKPLRNYYLNACLKNSFEWEKLSITEQSKNTEGFAFHSGIGFLNEYYINSKFAVLLYADQMLIGKSKPGNQFWSAGLGVRVVLNNFTNHKY